MEDGGWPQISSQDQVISSHPRDGPQFSWKLAGQWHSCQMQKGSETFPACSWIYRLCMWWMHKYQQDVSSCHYLQLGCCCPAPVGWWFIKSYLCLSQYFLLLSYLFAVSSAAPLHCFDLWFMLFYFLQSSAIFIYVALKRRFANAPVPATSSVPPLCLHSISYLSFD